MGEIEGDRELSVGLSGLDSQEGETFGTIGVSAVL